MIKINNYFFLIIISFFLTFFFCIKSKANENLIYLSLKNKKVNLRQGPSFDHPIKLIYKKKYLPLIILDKSDVWRKIQDFENNSGWIHISQLSKKKAAIVSNEELLVFKNPTVYSKPLVILEKGRLCIIKKCKEDWCKVEIDKFSGWVKKDGLWGRL